MRRFGLFFKKTMMERPIQLIGLMVLTLAASLLVYAIIRTLVGFTEAQNISFIFGLVGGGSILASFVFGYFATNASGTSFLTLPVSSLEKWLTAVIITLIIFPAFFLVFYRMIDVAFVTAYRNSLDVKGPFYKELYEMVNYFDLKGFAAKKCYMTFLNFTGAAIVASLYYNKQSFIKVALLVCGLLFAGHFLNYAMAKAVFDDVDRALPYYCVFVPAGKSFGKVLLPDYASKAVDICTFIIVPALLWIVAYIRLREKEF